MRAKSSNQRCATLTKLDVMLGYYSLFFLAFRANSRFFLRSSFHSARVKRSRCEKERDKTLLWNISLITERIIPSFKEFLPFLKPH